MWKLILGLVFVIGQIIYIGLSVELSHLFLRALQTSWHCGLAWFDFLYAETAPVVVFSKPYAIILFDWLASQDSDFWIVVGSVVGVLVGSLLLKRFIARSRVLQRVQARVTAWYRRWNDFYVRVKRNVGRLGQIVLAHGLLFALPVTAFHMLTPTSLVRIELPLVHLGAYVLPAWLSATAAVHYRRVSYSRYIIKWLQYWVTWSAIATTVNILLFIPFLPQLLQMVMPLQPTQLVFYFMLWMLVPWTDGVSKLYPRVADSFQWPFVFQPPAFLSSRLNPLMLLTAGVARTLTFLRVLSPQYATLLREVASLVVPALALAGCVLFPMGTLVEIACLASTYLPIYKTIIALQPVLLRMEAHRPPEDKARAKETSEEDDDERSPRAEGSIRGNDLQIMLIWLKFWAVFGAFRVAYDVLFAPNLWLPFGTLSRIELIAMLAMIFGGSILFDMAIHRLSQLRLASAAAAPAGAVPVAAAPAPAHVAVVPLDAAQPLEPEERRRRAPARDRSADRDRGDNASAEGVEGEAEGEEEHSDSDHEGLRRRRH